MENLSLPPTATKSRAHSDIVQKRLGYTFSPWCAVADWCHDGCQQERDGPPSVSPSYRGV